jgi:hypothetical protein
LILNSKQQKSKETTMLNRKNLSIFLTLFLVGVGLLLLAPAQAQKKASKNPTPTKEQKPPTPTPSLDSEIAKMVAEVSKENLEAIVKRLAQFGTRHSLSDTLSQTEGIGAARRWVMDQLAQYGQKSNGRMTAYLDPFVVPAGGRIPHEVTMKNVLGVLKGTDPQDDRVLIISGHLDSRGSDVMNGQVPAPGANDDASGVALVMELARIMSEREFPATIIFMAVSGEEQGLLGARHMAEKCKAEGINVVAMLNNDMVGNTLASETNIRETKRVRVFSETIPAVETPEMERLRKSTGGENDSPSRQLARLVKEQGEKYTPGHEVVLNYRIDRFLRGGDHTPFSQNGFTAVRLCEMVENYKYQHQDVRMENGEQYGDLPEFVDYDYLTQNTKVNLAALATLAKAPYAPDDVRIKIDLGNNTTLSWKAPKGPSPAGYQVLVRETHQSNWEKVINVEDTNVTLPYSKDNYLFGVRSVDKLGNPSLTIFPAPRR